MTRKYAAKYVKCLSEVTTHMHRSKIVELEKELLALQKKQIEAENNALQILDSMYVLKIGYVAPDPEFNVMEDPCTSETAEKHTFNVAPDKNFVADKFEELQKLYKQYDDVIKDFMKAKAGIIKMLEDSK